MLPPSLISSLASPGRGVVTICSEMGPGKVRPLTFLSPSLDTSLWLVRHRESWPLIGPHYGHEHYGHWPFETILGLWSSDRATQEVRSSIQYWAGDMEHWRALSDRRLWTESAHLEESLDCFSGIKLICSWFLRKAINECSNVRHGYFWREQEQRPLCKYEPKQLSFDPREQKDGLLTLITTIVSSSCLRVFEHNNCCSVDEKRRLLFVFITDIFMILTCSVIIESSYLVWSLIVGNNHNYTNSAGN